jgi:hypothetical protein
MCGGICASGCSRQSSGDLLEFIRSNLGRGTARSRCASRENCCAMDVRICTPRGRVLFRISMASPARLTPNLEAATRSRSGPVATLQWHFQESPYRATQPGRCRSPNLVSGAWLLGTTMGLAFQSSLASEEHATMKHRFNCPKCGSVIATQSDVSGSPQRRWAFVRRRLRRVWHLWWRESSTLHALNRTLNARLVFTCSIEFKFKRIVAPLAAGEFEQPSIGATPPSEHTPLVRRCA